MPLATSPMMSEILPLPPKTINTTAPTMSQCQIDRPPIAKTSEFYVRRDKATRHGSGGGDSVFATLAFILAKMRKPPSTTRKPPILRLTARTNLLIGSSPRIRPIKRGREGDQTLARFIPGDARARLEPLPYREWEFWLAF